jgi:hypothetical protein
MVTLLIFRGLNCFARYNKEQVLHEALRISLINPLIELSPYQSIAAGLCAGARNHFSDTLTAGASVAAKWPPLLASW